MGLDITAYRQLTLAPDAEIDDGYPVDDGVWLPGVSMEWSEEHWPGRGEGLVATMPYRFAERLDFRAGSYGGYNQWREWLDSIRSEPNSFYELIDFADNEGVIGPIVSAKLAKDFTAHLEIVPKDRWYREKYLLWHKAFLMASDGGAVDFH